MTKADLVTAICGNSDIKKENASELLEDLLEIIKTALEAGEEVKIVGFGKFEVRNKLERRGRNPQTGETITIESRKILTFKPSTILKKLINM